MNQTAQVSLQSIWSLLSDLSIESKKWLIGRLNEDIEKNTNSSLIHESVEEKLAKLDFPKLPKDFKVSQEVLDNVLGPLPDGLDCDKLTDEMWEEYSKSDIIITRDKDGFSECGINVMNVKEFIDACMQS